MSSTLKDRIIKEIEDLPSELQEKIIKLVHSMKEEILASKKVKPKKTNALSDVDEITLETGIPDLSFQHDHYLYGSPKK
jgi:hypothetical protein